MFENFAFTQISNLLKGGSSSVQSGGCGRCMTESLTFFVIVFVFLLIRAYILQLSFNYIVPRLMDYSNSEKQFRKLNYYEALVLLIFTNTLVGR
jgi:hypothetical protein